MSDCKNYVSEEDIKALKESELHIEHVARSRNLAGEKVLSVTDTIRGEKVTNRTLDGLEELYQNALSNIGYQQMGDYKPGITIDGRNQIVFENGSWFIYRGDLPHVTTGATLTEDGGVWSEENPDGQWVNIGFDELRGELKSQNGSKMIGWKRNSITAFLRTLDDKVSDFIHLRDFISDEISVTQALQNAIDYIFSLNVDSPLINYSTNSGYKKLAIGGDLHLIDSPILIPPKKGGVIICDGSLKASDSFPVGEPIFKYDRSGDNSDIKFMDLFFDCNRRANGILFDLYIKNVVDNCHFEAMRDYAIKTQYMGFELMITDCFIQEYWNQQEGSLNPTSTGVIFGAGTSDNHINNTVINSCRHPFEDYGQANTYNMLHIYGDGNIDLDTTRSILGENCQHARFTSCYFDTNILEVRNPRNLIITGGCKFLGGRSVNNKSLIVFKPTIQNAEVYGVIITGNNFATVSESSSCNAFGYDLSLGSFRPDGVKNTHIYGNSSTGRVTMSGTRIRKSNTVIGGTQVTVDFKDLIVFNANLKWFSYVTGGNIQSLHIGKMSGKTVVVDFNNAGNHTVSAEVDCSTNNNGVV